MPIMGSFSKSGISSEEAQNLVNSNTEYIADKIDKLMEIVKELKDDKKELKELITKIAATISKMDRDNEANRPLFDKLDAWLEPFYRDPYQTGDY